MFKQRLLTALVLVPIVLLAIYYAHPRLLGLVVFMMLLTAGWEWSRLMPIISMPNKVIFMMLVIAISGLSLFFLNQWLVFGLIVWAGILLSVLTFPASKTYWGHPIVVGLVCLILLPLLASSLVALYQLPQGKDLLVYFLCLVWAADIGAYLAGKSWGRMKMIPQVSPGKTWEGTAGGVALALLVAFIGYLYFSPGYPASWFVIALCTILISILGDLFISILKRRCNLKDTGCIFPGHGGLLDRIDSQIAALPIFYLGLQCLSPVVSA